MPFTPNLVVGAGFMLLGLVLILDRLNLAEARALLSLWPMLLILFGASVVVQALRGDGGASSPDGNRQTDTLPLVVLLVVAFLLVSHVEARREVRAAPAGTYASSVFTIMGRKDHAAPAQPFHGGEITTVMGRTHLDLRQAIVEPGGEAVVDVVALMGRVEITVPPAWSVDVQTTSFMAGVRSRRTRADAPADQVAPGPPDALERADPLPGPGPAPRLVLRGIALMGGLVVQ